MIIRQKNHPGVAAVLSFVFNGLGQIYNGQISKGLIIITVSATCMFIFILGSILLGFWFLNRIMFSHQLAWGWFLFLLGIISIGLLGIYSILDAYNVASRR